MKKRVLFTHRANASAIKLASYDAVFYLDNTKKDQAAARQDSIVHVLNKVALQHREDKNGYARSWTQKWAFKSGLLSALTYKGFSFWYPLEFFMHDTIRLFGYDGLSNLLLLIDAAKHILDEYKPQHVTCDDDNHPLTRILAQLCKQRKIRFETLGLPTRKTQSGSKVPGVIIKAYIAFRVACRTLIGCVAKRPQQGTVLFLTSDRFTRRTNREDDYWGPLVTTMKRAKVPYAMVEYDRPESARSLWKMIRRYVFSRCTETTFIGAYYSRRVARERRTIKRFLRRTYKTLDHDPSFRASMAYKNVPLYDLFKPAFRTALTVYNHYVADVYATSEAIMRETRPHVLLCDHEKNYVGRALLTYARGEGVPTICFEGETIYGTNTYQTQVVVPGVNDSLSPSWRPLPDVKLVWGTRTKRWHQQQNRIPASHLKIIGAPKYDFLQQITPAMVQSFKQRLGVRGRTPLIGVFTSATLWEKTALSEVLEFLQNKKKAFVIIKPHPQTSRKLLGALDALLKAKGVRGVIVKDESCGIIIKASSFIVTTASTIIYEAILLNTPVFLFGSYKTRYQPYVQSGLIKGVPQSDIKRAMSSFIRGKEKLGARQRAAFIKEYLYKDDGRASERAYKEIMRLYRRTSAQEENTFKARAGSRRHG